MPGTAKIVSSLYLMMIYHSNPMCAPIRLVGGEGDLQMNISDLLELLDGCGITYTDEQLVQETLEENGLSFNDRVGNLVTVYPYVDDHSKNFSVSTRSGSKWKYEVSYHDGVQTHKDGSAFYDIRFFANKPSLNAFTSKLLSEGYTNKGLWL